MTLLDVVSVRGIWSNSAILPSLQSNVTFNLPTLPSSLLLTMLTK